MASFIGAAAWQTFGSQDLALHLNLLIGAFPWGLKVWEESVKTKVSPTPSSPEALRSEMTLPLKFSWGTDLASAHLQTHFFPCLGLEVAGFT